MSIKTRNELEKQRDLIRAKYPRYPKDLPKGEEPLEVLQHCRDVVAYTRANPQDFMISELMI